MEALIYYKAGQESLQRRTGFLCYKAGQMLLQSKIGITKWSTFYYEIRACITKWGEIYYKIEHLSFILIYDKVLVEQERLQTILDIFLIETR